MSIDRISTTDEQLSTIIKTSLEFILRSKRELLQELAPKDLRAICLAVMNLITIQEQQILTVVFEISSKNGYNFTLDKKDLITWRSDSDESLREVLLRFLA